MPTINHADGTSESFLPQAVIDILMKVFLVAIIATVGAFGYLLYGLFSGALAAATTTHEIRLHANQLVQSTSNILNISLAVTLVCGLLLFYENEAIAIIMLAISAFLLFGLQFLLDYLSSQSGNLTASDAAKATMREIKQAAVMIGVPGVLLFLWNMIQRIRDARTGVDLADMKYGKEVAEEEVRGSLVGAFAKCWQLPFCREGIRVKCPIYHARTKCWKQRVGCMCEENVLRLAAGGDEHKPIDMTQSAGFVPIGDLIVNSEKEARPSIPTRVGPRGVRIPTNPHLTEGQKRERCRNCVIYNEHQRQKYGLASPLVTIAIPILVFLNFEPLKDVLMGALTTVDKLIGHLNFNGPAATHGPSQLSMDINGSLPIAAILIMALTLLIMTWALRFLEYCMFQIKI